MHARIHLLSIQERMLELQIKRGLNHGKDGASKHFNNPMDTLIEKYRSHQNYRRLNKEIIYPVW